MIKTMTAFTFEVDDPDAAAAEILEQIDLKALRKNSLGILTCFTEFAASGVVQAVCAALPFDAIGITTAGTAVPGGAAEIILGLLVLTSDNAEFITGAVEISGKDMDGHIYSAYKETCAKGPGLPVMMLAFVPFIKDLGGEIIVQSLGKASGGIPFFGSLAIDLSPDYSINRSIYNGKTERNTLVFALLYGDLHPSFFVASIPEDKIHKQRGVITKSKDNFLMEVNNMPVLDYLQSIGIRKKNGVLPAAFFPFVIDYNDGTKPVVRSIYLMTKEGYAACGGAMPENATLSVGGIDYYDVIRTCGETLEKIQREKEKGSCLLMFSCLTRYFALDAYTTAEMETVRDRLTDFPGYLFSYSGGEICPVYNWKGYTSNRFHNCTFAACLL
ncbi:MAG: FIST C-terminal domain-containing protein [Treponema sp.]|jgi:hypothetical protein|nr:FIST C-terminal domain-containing protein [Treponema sp.]